MTAPPRSYHVVFMTTRYRSLEEVRTDAPAQLSAHLERSRRLHADGVLVMAGAFLDRPDQPVQTMGVLTSREGAEDYARRDPFVRAGMITDRAIRRWASMLT